MTCCNGSIRPILWLVLYLMCLKSKPKLIWPAACKTGNCQVLAYTVQDNATDSALTFLVILYRQQLIGALVW